jgi:hypothetical protein
VHSYLTLSPHLSLLVALLLHFWSHFCFRVSLAGELLQEQKDIAFLHAHIHKAISLFLTLHM